MASQKTETKTSCYGVIELTITHGILLAHGTFDLLIHEMDEITKNDARRENKIVNWEETRIFDNTFSGRYQRAAIYRERWR